MQTSVWGWVAVYTHTIKPHRKWIAECSTSLIYLNNDREVPAVIFLSRSIRVLWWSSHPSWAPSEIQSPHPLLNPSWEDWEPSALSAPLTKGPPMVCPALRRRRRRVGTPIFLKSSAGGCHGNAWTEIEMKQNPLATFKKHFSLYLLFPSCPGSPQSPGSSLQHRELFCPSAQHIRQQQSVFFGSQRPHTLTAGSTKTRGHRQPVSGQHRPHEGKDLCYFRSFTKSFGV